MDLTPDPNQRLKQAINSIEAPPFLEARIRNQVFQQKPRSVWNIWLMPATAAMALCFGMGVAYQLGHLRLTEASQESYVATLTSKVTRLMSVGLGDHVHCSIFGKKPATPASAEAWAEKMGPQYAGLIPLLKDQAPSQFQIVEAHKCSYHERKFVHLLLAGDGHLLSVVIAVKGEGESLRADSLAPMLVQSGLPIYQSNVQRFGIEAFETRDHLVYLVSDLPLEKNRAVLQALAPTVSNFLKGIEL